MVRFESDKLVIEIQTLFPVETWIVLHGGIYDLARNVNQDTVTGDFYSVIDFLRELMPDYDTVKKMME
ncbi:MAG: hypothetical protein LBL04_14010 [Bacteroidales bacterium]|jgi:hypothetical protein|nr:hypothetical protein [Bacteroidales bacterium]